MRMHTNNTNIKVLAIILLVGFSLFNFIFITFAAPPAGQDYPYVLGTLTAETKNLAACRERGDQTELASSLMKNKIVCIPAGSTAKPLGSSGCSNMPGFLEKQIPGTTDKFCLSTIKDISSLTNIECPTGSKKQIPDLNNPATWFCAKEITDPAKECPLTINRVTLTDGKQGCLVIPNKLMSGQMELVEPGSGAIKQTIRPYLVSFPIPCKIIPGIGGECPSTVTTPAEYITRLYQFGLMIVGFAAFASIVYGAIKYILSAGITSMQQDAKDQMYDAILGLILLLGAFLILYTINPALVNLTNPSLAPLNLESLIQKENAGQPQQLTGSGNGGSAADDLCALKVNAQIDVNVNANTQNRLPDIPPAVDLSGVKLPQGTQATGFKCINCKDNAHRVGDTLGLGGTCECDSGFVKNDAGSLCITLSECTTNLKGTIESGKCVPGGQQGPAYANPGSCPTGFNYIDTEGAKYFKKCVKSDQASCPSDFTKDNFGNCVGNPQ